MLPRDLPEVQGMDQLNRFFSRDGQLIVTVKADEAFLADEALVALADELESHPDLVSEVFRELTLTELVTEGGNLLAWLWLNAPPEELANLAGRLSKDRSAAVVAESMDTLQAGFFDQNTIVTSYDPLGFSRIGSLLGEGLDEDLEESGRSNPDPMASEDGTFQVMYVEGSGVDFSNYRDAADWLKELKPIVSEWEETWLAAQPEGSAVTVGLTGTPAFMAEVGSEMEKDMTISVILTMSLISLLFWIMHRRTRPLSWLISAMLAILAITIFIGGLIFGNLSVMSAGFAAILMGLAVDYGIVIYREAMDSGHDAKTLRRTVGPGILWAAATTAVVFLSLNLSSLPGLAEMGNLVAMGVCVGALVMLFVFAPVAVSFNRDSPRKRGVELEGEGLSGKIALLSAILVPVLAIASMALREWPHLEANFHPFRIRESPSMVAWQKLQSELLGRENSVPTVITGRSIEDLHEQIEVASSRIDKARSSGLIQSSVLPSSFVPHPENQEENAAHVKEILENGDRLIAEIEGAGFSEDGTQLTRTIFSAWSGALDELGERSYALPQGKLAKWSIDRLFSEQEGTVAALATVKPVEPQDRTWVTEICNENIVVASLGSLGTALNERIGEDLLRVFLPMMGLLSAMLLLVFRSWKNLVLSLGSLLFTAAGMILITVWSPMSWNSFNVCGLPLRYGTGLDVRSHLIFALTRSNGNVSEARHGIGKALVFC
ncbi:MAG: MMPL family transporter, partial [Verrucomicrobiota bacterium]